MRRLTLTVDRARHGTDVNTLLRKELALSAAAVRRAKALDGGITLDGLPVFTTARAGTGQVLSVAVGDEASNPAIEAVEGTLDIRYEDDDLLILDKAGGVPVHPSQGHHGDTLANFLYHHYETIGLTAAFHPVNRLDRGTSGLMAVAKHAHAHERLQAQLRDGTLKRTYLAVCQGVPDPLSGVIDLPIARQPGSVLRRQADPAGSPARTRYRVLDTGNGRSLVALALDTGRTHQIRVHLSWLGCPLAGDFLYGTEDPALPNRFALHSASLTLRQPVTGQVLALTSPLPDELYALLQEN